MGDNEYLKSYLAEGETSEEGKSEESPKEEKPSEEEPKNLDLNPDDKEKINKKSKQKDKKASKGKIPHVALPDLTKVPHPSGSIGMILLLILVLLFAVVPAPSGGSRLQLLFSAMLGKVKIGGTSVDTGAPASQSSTQTAATTPSDSSGGASYDTGSVVAIGNSGASRR